VPANAKRLSPRTELEHARRELSRQDPLWPEHLTVLAVILLSLALPDALSVGPRWLLPAAEGVLFLALVSTTPRGRRVREPPRRRQLRIGLVSLMSGANVASLFFLARFGIDAHHVNGHALLGGGAVLWLTAVLLFALWYWEMDRGGPIERAAEPDTGIDFVFPQMQDPRWAPDGWLPRIPDFLYLSFVNAATFAPPESHFPLTSIGKLVLSLQALGALVTDTLIVARAVNMLG
jgi:uncharacterized membrane protein